jgi:hypothetical protein
MPASALPTRPASASAGVQVPTPALWPASPPEEPPLPPPLPPSFPPGLPHATATAAAPTNANPSRIRIRAAYFADFSEARKIPPGQVRSLVRIQCPMLNEHRHTSLGLTLVAVSRLPRKETL